MAIDNKLISISLFTGAFGLDLGLEKAGFNTVSVVEIDPDSSKTIAINKPHLLKSAIARNIQDVSSSQLLVEGGETLNLGRSLKKGELDLITGGPPCQPFSTAGKRLSVGDPRGSLFVDFLRIVNETKPRFFLMENVRGLLSAPIKHRPHKQRGANYPPLLPEEMSGAALEAILSEIEAIGYKVIYKLLQAADYGVPQTRLRVFFLASRDNETLSFPTVTHSKKKKDGLPLWLTLKSALQDLEDSSIEHTSYSKQRLKYLKLLKAGENWRFLPEELKPEAMGGAYKSGGGKVGFYRRLSWEKPSPTITTSPHQKATDMCHPEELRPLTVRECARIQTFPDSWIFYGSISSKYRQIGNAVPVLLGKAIGKHLYKIFKKENMDSEPINKQLLLFNKTIDFSFTRKETTYSSNYIKKHMINEKQLIKVLLKDAGVSKSSLLTEKILTIDKYIHISEEELKEFQWIDKKGKNIPMVKNAEVNKIIAKRDLYLQDIEDKVKQVEKLNEVYIWLSHIPSIKNLLKKFTSTRKAGIIARKIKTIENIKINSTAFSETLNSLAEEEKENIVNLFLQKEHWNCLSIRDLPWKVNIFAKTIALRAKLRQENIAIDNKDLYSSFEIYLLKNWYRIKDEPDLLINNCNDLGFVGGDIDNENLKIVAKLLLLKNSHLNIALLFLNEIIKMSVDVPNLAKEAIATGNPFLFRSLFLDFKEAEEFAVGGKLNSSLETKYGNLFEKLMSAFDNCREINDGGVDVIVENNAFDIKSGPNVMNKSMVDAFSAKQVLIQDKKILPEIISYKIALGYGRREDLNSFMAKIDSDILTARESWTTITGVQHSPEIVFEIAGLIPKIFGFKSIVGSLLNKAELKQTHNRDNSQFVDIFKCHFDEIQINSEAQKEILKIRYLFE